MYKIMQCSKTGVKMLVPDTYNENENNSLQNLRQAGTNTHTSQEDVEMLNTFLAFMNGDESYTGPTTTKRNLFQGATVTKKQQANIETDDPITVTNTFLEFGGML